LLPALRLRSVQSSSKWAAIVAAKDEALAAKDVALAAKDEALAAKGEALAAKNEALAVTKEQALALSERLALKERELALVKMVSPICIPCPAPRVQDGGWRLDVYPLSVPCKRLRSYVVASERWQLGLFQRCIYEPSGRRGSVVPCILAAIGT